LPEFNQQEVQQLVCQYGFQWSISQIEQLMGMMGGYPPLVQQTLTHLKTHPDVTLEQILETATLESGIYSNHLRSHLWNLKQHPELALAFKQVVSATEAVQLVPMQTHQLLSLGLVILSGNDVKPRCKLYRQYFSDRLGDI
jgi:AAA-like domain